MRAIGVRAFRKNIANELRDLPCVLTVHGGAVAVVNDVKPECRPLAEVLFEPEITPEILKNPKIQGPEIIDKSQLSTRAGDLDILDELKRRYEERNSVT